MRKRQHLYKWQRQRQEFAARKERVKRLRDEVERAHSRIGRLDPESHHKEIKQLTARIRTLEQQIRYINIDHID